MIGVICAEKKEIDMIRQDFTVTKTETVSGRNFFVGTLYGAECVLVLARIGKVAAAVTATILLERYKAKKLIFAGSAGAVDSSLRVGDIIIGDRLVQHDMDSFFNPLFMIPLTHKTYFMGDSEMVSKAVSAAKEFAKNDLDECINVETKKHFGLDCPSVYTGTIASGDQFIADSEKKKWLSENIENLKCCEMEGGAVAQVCDEFFVPFLCIRVISDSADDKAPFSYDEFTEKIVGYFTRGIIKRLLSKNV